MSMADNYNRRKKEEHAEEQVSDDAVVRKRVRQFNHVTMRLLDQFEQRFENNEIPMNNIPDYIRLLGAFKEMNQVGEIMDNAGQSGDGAPPALSIPQKERLQNRADEGKFEVEESEDEEGESYIDLEGLTQEDAHQLIEDMVYEQNKVNEGGNQ